MKIHIYENTQGYDIVKTEVDKPHTELYMYYNLFMTRSFYTQNH